MKELIRKIVDFVLNRKIADLDNDGKIETLREEIAGLFSQFQTMSDTLQKANGELQGVIEDEARNQELLKEQLENLVKEYEGRIEASKAVAGKAQSGIDTNDKIHEKVKEFIV